MRICPEELREVLTKVSFQSAGDQYEQEFGQHVAEQFPNIEVFWRYFVVPLTQRLERFPNVISSIGFRDNIKPELEDIANAHYSLFMNLVYAHLHLQNWEHSPCPMEDIYVNLGSACDLAETVLEKWYLLMLNCQDVESHVLQNMSRADFLDLAGKWYDEKYEKMYEYYLSKGRHASVSLVSRPNIIKEYFGKNSEARVLYRQQSQQVRTFRNVIVHNTRIGRIVSRQGIHLVPDPGCITKYRTWRAVDAATGDPEIIRQDFVIPREQAEKDITLLEEALNNLWQKLIEDFQHEFFHLERNSLRKLYDVEFSIKPIWEQHDSEHREQTDDFRIIASGISDGGAANPSFPEPSSEAATGGSAEFSERYLED